MMKLKIEKIKQKNNEKISKSLQIDNDYFRKKYKSLK